MRSFLFCCRGRAQGVGCYAVKRRLIAGKSGYDPCLFSRA
jgi:hypothetical protein